MSTAQRATARKGRRSRTPLTPEQRAERMAEAKAQLDAGVDALLTSEGWRRLVESRRWLRTYSPTNQIMILTQCPGATDVRPLSKQKAAERVMATADRILEGLG